MHRICSFVADILWARRGLKKHKTTQVLNWQWPQPAAFSLRPSGNLAWKEQSLRMREAPYPAPPSTVRYFRYDQSWHNGPVPIWVIWASCGSGVGVHSWVGVRVTDVYVEKFAVGFPGCSRDIFFCQSSGLLCEGIIWYRATAKHMALDWVSSWLWKRHSVLVLHGNTLM